MAAMEVDTPPDVLIRADANYVNQDADFIISSHSYQQQYASLYFSRLAVLRRVVEERARVAWPAVLLTTILDLKEQQECVVVGTLYKEMKLKPSILDEYAKERSNVPLVTPSKLTDASDSLVLEDDRGRIRLQAGEHPLAPDRFVTGVVVAVRGREQAGGVFLVDGLLEPGLAPQLPRPVIPPIRSGASKVVVLVSGLAVGANATNPLSLSLLFQHLGGDIGGNEVASMSARTVRVVVAGNSVASPAEMLNGQQLSARDQRKLALPVKELDVVLAELSSAIPVDVMPGPSDPANFALPQQPLHPCLLPGTSQFSTFTAATNPHKFEIDGVSFLGTSGQPLDDIFRYSGMDDRLSIAESFLQWRHLAPSAPDTLTCYPFHRIDPFILKHTPHVFFVGNQPEFATRLVKGPNEQVVRIILVPRFAETELAVQVDLDSLECEVLRISTGKLRRGDGS